MHFVLINVNACDKVNGENITEYLEQNTRLVCGLVKR